MEAKDFGAKLRDLRKRARLSQRALAEKAGIDFTYLSKIETGKMPPPSRDVVLRLAEALDVDRDELLISAGRVPSEMAEVLRNGKTLQFLRKRVQKRKRSSSKREGAATMNYKTLGRVAIAFTLVMTMGGLLWFTGPAQLARAFNVAMSVSNSPISGNTTYLLGEQITIPANMQFAALERKDLTSVTLNVTGPESFAVNLPYAAGTYTNFPDVPGNLSVAVGLTGTATTAQGQGYGYGYGGALSGNVTFNIKWTPPYVLTTLPPPPPPALPGNAFNFTISVPDEVNQQIWPSLYYPQGMSYNGTHLQILVPASVPFPSPQSPNEWRDAIIITDTAGNYVNHVAAPGQSWQTEALANVGSTLYAAVNFWDNQGNPKGKVLKLVGTDNWTEVSGLTSLNSIGGLASDGTNLFIAYRDSPLKIDKRSPSTGALITSFDLSTAWGPGGFPPMWGFDALAYDDSVLYAAQGDLIIKVDASSGAKTMEWKTGKWGIRGLEFVPYGNSDTKVLYMAVTDQNVYWASKIGDVPLVENTPIGDYTAVFKVLTDNPPAPITRSFTLTKLSTAPVVAITSPSANFAVGAGSENITVSGSVNDPSITSVIVGVALPEATAFEDNVEDLAQANAKWAHKAVPGMNPWGPPYSSEDLWHRSTTRSNDTKPGVGAVGAAWRYANPSTNNYDTPFKANAGALQTKAKVSIGTDNKLTFWTWYDTEWDFWPDRKVVEVSTDNVSWQKVSWLAKFWPPFPPPEIPMQDWNTLKKVEDRVWTKVEVGLSAFAGQDVYIRFRMDTMDDWGNMGEGWYIDDVNITGAGFLGKTVSLDSNLQFTTWFVLAEGENILTARAARTAYAPQLIGEASVTGSLDLNAPVLTLNPVTTPTNQQYQTVSGVVVEPNFDRLELKVNGQLKWTTTVLGSGGTFSQPILLNEGNNTIFVEARDKLGLSSNRTAAIKLDTTGPAFEAVFPGSDNRTYDVAYMTGESSARPGDFFFIALKVSDAASNVTSVRLITPNQQDSQDGPQAFTKAEIPEAVIDSWGIKENTKEQMNYVIPMQLPSGLPSGDYTWTVVAQDAAGNTSNQTVPTKIVTSLEAFNTYLMPDWNLVSLPVMPTTPSVATLVNSANATGLFERIWYYDASQNGTSAEWTFFDSSGAGDLTTLGAGKGYWLKMKPLTSFTEAGKVSGPMAVGLPNTPAPVKLTVAGTVLLPQQVPPTYTVYAGWNLIGLHAEYARDINTALAGVKSPTTSLSIWASLLEYQNYIYFPMEQGGGGQPQIVLGGFATDSTKFRTSGKMTPGQGYWLYVIGSGGAIVP
ncbi:MAG: helix-turn-helix domain-containing protein [Chloroflexi bacterium]|nr:helix-turn-helix domain-containing protein [Chloroflexota bacterium]